MHGRQQRAVAQVAVVVAGSEKEMEQEFDDDGE